MTTINASHNGLRVWTGYEEASEVLDAVLLEIAAMYNASLIDTEGTDYTLLTWTFQHPWDAVRFARCVHRTEWNLSTPHDIGSSLHQWAVTIGCSSDEIEASLLHAVERELGFVQRAA